MAHINDPIAHRHGDMNDEAHSGAHGQGATTQSLNRTAVAATIHCLTGCAIGEVAGMVIGTGFGWSNLPTIVLSIVLAFTTGYALTMIPLIRAGLGLKRALILALASDTVSVGIMEVVDNLIMLVVPGAMSATLAQPLFWLSLAGSLLLAGIAAYPVNRWLIARGKGHAVIHAYHAH